MSFLTYKETRPWAAAIREAVVTRKMPPWHADPHYGNFSNDRSLSQHEVDLLSKWAMTGGQEGNPHDAPRARTFADGWTIGEPDLVLDTGIDYAVASSGTLDYVNFLVPSGLKTDQWIEKIEIRPGNRSVVHHVILYSRPPGSSFRKGIQPGVPFIIPKSDHGKFRADDPGELRGLDGQAEMLAVYAPGAVAPKLPSMQARLISAGSDLLLSVHYTTNGKAAIDRTRVGIVFAKSTPRERVINTALTTTNVRIPAGADNYSIQAHAIVHREVKVLTVMPHMHLRGKSFECKVRYPTGEEQTILRVPRYDFNWQTTYYLAQPLILPKGTEIKVTGWYDNSPNNPFNPDPRTEVVLGEQSWNEMLVGFLDFAISPTVEPTEIIKEAKDLTAAKTSRH
jgi:hypothetical protein